MALIGTLRTKMTKFVVGFVALAMGAFIVGSDLFGNGPRSVFGGNKNNVGEIAGTSISIDDYKTFVQDQENDYYMRTGKPVGERERSTVQDQAWELMIVKYAIESEMLKAGVKVTADEAEDMLWGKNIDPGIQRQFTDSTGKFNREALKTQLRSLDVPAPVDPQLRQQWELQQANWNRFKKSLYLGRQRVKYENLMIKTNYVTKAEAERDYHNQNDVAEAKILFVPYFAMSDSTVKVTDGDLKAYYNENKEKYKSKFTRSLSYVSFPVVASSEDSAKTKSEATKIATDFKTVAEDSLYAASNTEGTSPYTKYTIANLPPLVNKDQLTEGNVIGPLLAEGNYKIFKVVKTGKDTIYTTKASHILIRWDNETPEKKKEAKEKAQKILNDIKGGANFAAKAREFGMDGTASRGGDLGYFSSGQMVKPFQNAVFNAKKTGVLPDLVETQFGYHIIEVTALKDNTYYKVAIVELKILPSDETHKIAYLKAQNFATGVSGVEAFKQKAEKEKLNVLEAKELGPNDQRVGNLGSARKVVTWLFRDAKEGNVDAFDLDDTYGVAVMTGETEEGYLALDQVKERITPTVRNQLKGKKIVEKLNAQKGTLDELAKTFGHDAQVNAINDLKFNTNSLPGAGLDPKAVGVAFSLENGKRSLPVASENGVIIVELQNKTTAPEVGDYATFKNELEKAINSRSGLNIAQAIKDLSDIKDKRYKFY